LPPSASTAAADDAVEVPVSEPLAARETQRLYRLKAASLAVVAADAEDEARTSATLARSASDRLGSFDKPFVTRSNGAHLP
jgi:hypothetical protein